MFANIKINRLYYLVKCLTTFIWSRANKWNIWFFQQLLKSPSLHPSHAEMQSNCWFNISRDPEIWNMHVSKFHLHSTWMPPSSPKRPCITGNTMSTEAARCSAKSDKDWKPWARLQKWRISPAVIFNLKDRPKLYSYTFQVWNRNPRECLNIPWRFPKKD